MKVQAILDVDEDVLTEACQGYEQTPGAMMDMVSAELGWAAQSGISVDNIKEVVKEEIATLTIGCIKVSLEVKNQTNYLPQTEDDGLIRVDDSITQIMEFDPETDDQEDNLIGTEIHNILVKCQAQGLDDLQVYL